ncbi:MAG: CDP-alcohol phosphatidyltransferase family protein [Proteobacteria bacterium]|nr:CDP-alcohol phosphatidyltransferase family protein [Pseudomonadota bacterium]
MNINNLPNAITLARIFLVPVLIVVLKQGNYQAALAIFLIAGISDGLDGFIAKRYNMVTHLGAVLDPLADKLLLVSTYVMLTVLGDVPFWLMVAVASRDVLIVGGYLTVTSISGPVKMQPSWLSKFNTVMQIVLVLIILVQRSYGIDMPLLNTILFVVVLLTTIASGFHYIWLWLVKHEVSSADESTNKTTNK